VAADKKEKHGKYEQRALPDDNSVISLLSDDITVGL